jgi:hypothetical protein
MATSTTAAPEDDLLLFTTDIANKGADAIKVRLVDLWGAV